LRWLFTEERMYMMNLPVRPPLVVHHMAALDGTFPPNSLEAVRACLEADATFIEVDITALRERDYLLVHDPELESETSGQGEVGKSTPEQVRDLFLQSPETGEPTSIRPALLGDVVRAMLDYPNGARLQLDFKNVLPFPDDEPLRRLVKLIEPLGDRVIVSTGADWQLRRLRKLAGWLDLGFDVQFYIDWRQPGNPPDPRIPPFRLGAYGYWDDHLVAVQRFWPTAEYLAERCEYMARSLPGVSTFYIDHKLIAQSLDDGFNWAEALHHLNIRLDAWTMDVTNPAAVANVPRLLAAGVDQFTTNTPRELATLLAEA
jgi:glycerophosphoryl diester phosphodiesterase